MRNPANKDLQHSVHAPFAAGRGSLPSASPQARRHNVSPKDRLYSLILYGLDWHQSTPRPLDHTSPRLNYQMPRPTQLRRRRFHNHLLSFHLLLRTSVNWINSKARAKYLYHAVNRLHRSCVFSRESYKTTNPHPTEEADPPHQNISVQWQSKPPSSFEMIYRLSPKLDLLFRESPHPTRNLELSQEASDDVYREAATSTRRSLSLSTWRLRLEYAEVCHI